MKNSKFEIAVIIIGIPLLIAMIFGIINIDKKNVQASSTTELTTSSSFVENIEETSTTETTTSSSNNIQEEDIISLEEKYKSVFEWQVYSGDFRVEQLYFLESQCSKYDIPMELMLSIICTESGFRSYAKASTSSASGYCQIIKSTAKWIYEDKLHYGNYDVDNHVAIMTTNWKLNIEISCRLMYSLYYNNGKSWENAVKKYYGSTNPADNITYLNKVNRNMIDLFNITISDLT